MRLFPLAQNAYLTPEGPISFFLFFFIFFYFFFDFPRIETPTVCHMASVVPIQPP